MSKSIKEKYPLLFQDKKADENLDVRYHRAWQKARIAADILKKEYGAEKVWVFGSLIQKDRFNQKSDIDLAEVGIPDDKFYSAIAAITRVVRDFEIDLVDMKSCRDALKKAIEEEGILI